MSQMWSGRADTSSYSHRIAPIRHIISLFPKAAIVVVYLINNLPLLCYY